MIKKIILLTIITTFLFAAKKEESKNIQTIELDTIEFHPKIHKPELMSTMSRKRLKVDNIMLKKDFVPRIIESVDKKPF